MVGFSIDFREKFIAHSMGLGVTLKKRQTGIAFGQTELPQNITLVQYLVQYCIILNRYTRTVPTQNTEANQH